MTSPTVAIRDVSKQFGTVTALQGVTTTITPGVTGLLGPNGAGKTTLLRILSTILRPDQGLVEVCGLDPSRSPDRIEIRRRLGYMPQDNPLYEHFTVADFLDYLAVLKEFADRRARRAEVERVIDTVELTAVARRRIKDLSGGMRRRVTLAQALIGDPTVLVLDEPTAGLDPEQRVKFRQVISTLAGHRCIVLATHQTDDVATLCHDVVVIAHGMVRFQGRPEDLAQSAHGRVWTAPDACEHALASWQTGDRRYRHLGDPPPGAAIERPSVEDGYLVLLHREDAGAEGPR